MGWIADVSASASSAAAISGAKGAQGGFGFANRGAGSLTVENDKVLSWVGLAVLVIVILWLWRKI